MSNTFWQIINTFLEGVYITCGIYCIENNINKKKYIGQSINIEQRLYQHCSRLKNNNHQNNHLQGAWNKYGEDNFNMFILKSCKKRYLNRLEKMYIRIYESFYNGYNLTKGGDGFPLDEESRHHRALANSLTTNRIGVMNVSKFTDAKYKQGFRYRYQNSATGQHMYSYDLLKLKKKVENNNYKWLIINEDLYQQSLLENEQLRLLYDR